MTKSFTFSVLLSLAAVGAASGCAPATSLEQVSSAVEVEQEAHRRTVQKCRTLKGREQDWQVARSESAAEADALQAKVAQRDAEIAAREASLSEARQSDSEKVRTIAELREQLEQAETSLKEAMGRERKLEARIDALSKEAQRAPAQKETP